MILDKYIEIKITKRNLPHFIIFYKDIKLKDIVNVHPQNLQKSSGQFVNVCCDLCGAKRRIKYQAYVKNISSCLDHPIYTCDKCSHIKIKESNRKKWGVDYFSQTKEYGEKFKETMLDRWGVEYALQSEELKDKAKKTNIEKFGVENPFMDNEMIKTKFREKWGVDHPSKVPDIVDKIKTSTKKNWDEKKVERTEKCKQTNLEKWGLNRIIGSNSIKKNELIDFIKSIYGGEIIKSFRDSKEIDIYLPELNLGFEFNGLYWHSEKWKSKYYHIDKTNFFSKKGIRIIHIWEDDWVNKSDIIKSQISNWIGLSKRKIFGRNCVVRVVEKRVGISFLDKNHIQGSDKSVLKLGLYFGEELVSIMTFDHFEGRRRMEESGWNLSRFCNLTVTNVVGGASKLLSYFTSKYKPSRIVSYADRDWSSGGLYNKLGFKLVSESRPDYKYIVEGTRVHKSNFKKSKLKYTETEKEYVKKRGIEKVWDCGKMKFEILLK